MASQAADLMGKLIMQGMGVSAVDPLAIDRVVAERAANRGREPDLPVGGLLVDHKRPPISELDSEDAHPTLDIIWLNTCVLQEFFDRLVEVVNALISNLMVLPFWKAHNI